MKKTALTPLISTLLALGLSLTPPSTQACTSFLIKSSDNGYVYGRTLEFGIPLQSTLIAIPRNINYQGTGVDSHPGKAWKTKYAAIGMNGINLPVLVDGMNEKGMVGGLLYAPNTAIYQDVSAENSANSITSYEMLTYALTNFANVDEVKAGFQNIMINKTGHAPFNGTVPVHMTLHDAAGKSIVIEYNDAKLFVYDNPTTVLTNDPNFVYQTSNIGQYANLSPKEAKPFTINGASFSPPSSGSGLHGIPGDFLAPSRFIRAVAYAASAPTNLTADKQVATAFHILNNFDIPPGAIELSSSNPYGGGADGFEKTEWSSVADTKNLVYYVKTFENPTVQMLDMKKVNMNAKAVTTYKLQTNEIRVQVK